MRFCTVTMRKRPLKRFVRTEQSPLIFLLRAFVKNSRRAIPLCRIFVFDRAVLPRQKYARSDRSWQIGSIAGLCSGSKVDWTGLIGSGCGLLHIVRHYSLSSASSSTIEPSSKCFLTIIETRRTQSSRPLLAIFAVHRS